MGIFDNLFKKDSETVETEEKPKFDVSSQSGDEQKLVNFVKGRVDEVRQSGNRVAHEAIWMTNIAYLLGYDSIRYDSTSRSFRPIAQGARYLRANRVHVNSILPTLQNRLARLTKSKPKYDVRPNSNDNEDKQAARLALQVLNQIWDQQNINRKRLDLMMWVQQCGHAYLKVCWDDQLGKPMIDPDQEELMGYEGDVRIDVCSPFELFVDPIAKTLDEAQWVVQAKVRKLDYFKSRFGERGEAVKEEGAWLLSAQYEQRIQSINAQTPTSGNPQNMMKNSAIEMVLYERRSRKHPNGRMITVAGGILLEDKPLPIGEIPFVKFDDIIIGGKFYSESVVTHLRPLADYKNKNLTMRAAWLTRTLTSKVLAAKGHGMAQESLNDQSGEVLEYNPVPNAAPPTPLQMPTIPQYAYNEDEKVTLEMLDISGINQPSRGQMPSATIPAVGMQLLVEQDETRIGVMTEAHEESYARLGKFILEYVQNYYETPRLLKVAGKGRAYDVREFIGADLKNNTDVFVIPGSTVPSSKAMKRQELMNAYNSGLLGDPADPKVRSRVLSMMEYGDIAEVWTKQSLIDAQIERDMEMIKRGEDPGVNIYDDHARHFEVKNEYRISPDFDQLSDEAKALLLKNIEEHVEAQTEMTTPPEPTDEELELQADELNLANQNIEEEAQAPEGLGVEGEIT